MVKFPSTPNPKNVPEIFKKIQSIGVPTTKVTISYLKSIGFKSSYDGYLVGVLKSLGFVTADGSPTDRWQTYRVKKQAGSVMASAIRDTYSELFGTYPNACEESEDTLLDYFKGSTQASDEDIRRMVQTFRNLCALADFKGLPVEIPVSEHAPPREGVTPEVKIAPHLQLNIEIHIAADTPDDKIETIFKNMKKYLLTNE